MTMRTMFLVLVLLVFVGGASATDYYVSVTGDNSYQGNLTHPWQNVSYATQQAVAGDTIYLFDGTWYDEHAVFANSGNATHPITLTAYNGTPTLDGVDKTGGGIDLSGNSYIDIANLKVITYFNSMSDSTSSSYINISNCVLGNSGGVVISVYCGSHHIWIVNNTIYDSGWNTIQITGQETGSHLFTHHVYVKNNNFNNTVGHTGGVDIMGDTSDIDIIGNTFNNSNTMLYVHGQYLNGTYRVNVSDNICYNITGDGADFMWTRDSVAINNTIYYASNRGIYSYSGLVGRAINLTVKNNRVCDSGSYMYRLSTRSESGVGRGPLLVVDNNNEIDSTKYIIETDTTDGLLRFTKYAKPFTLIAVNKGKATTEFTDGRVFTQSIGSYPPTNITSPHYYPSKSNSTVENLGEGSSTVYVTTYNITLYPTNSYLKNVTVNHESDSNDDRTNISVTSSVTPNPTWINATMQNATHNYSVSVDGNIVDYVLADSVGVVSYNYTSSWSPHTFEFDWVDAGDFTPDHAKSYYNTASQILNTVNSTGYNSYNRTLDWDDTVVNSFSMVVKTT